MHFYSPFMLQTWNFVWETFRVLLNCPVVRLGLCESQAYYSIFKETIISFHNSNLMYILMLFKYYLNKLFMHYLNHLDGYFKKIY